MKTTRLAIATLSMLTIATFLAASASAHATIYSPDNKIKFVFGHLNEPVFTNQKTGLDLIISENATGKPISGLQYTGGASSHGEAAAGPTLYINYRYGAEGGPTKNITNDFRAQHGQVGRYTHPIVFTRPGLYYLVISGTVNGTVLNNLVLTPAHALETQDTITFPDTTATDTRQDGRLAQLEAKVAQLQASPARGAPGLEIGLLVGAIALCMVLLRRR